MRRRSPGKTGLFAFDWSTWIFKRTDPLEATVVRALVLLKNCQDDVEAMLFGPRESFAEEQLTFSEVFAYRMEKDLDWKANPLIWWRENQKKLPKLYKLAMRTLSAQATEVPSERAFSAAGLLHTKGRRRQLPGTLCRRLFVYANHPSLLQTRQHQPDSSDDEDEH